MQVANDVASAKELPSREARPGRRVNKSAAASSARIASRALWSVVSLAESAAFVAHSKHQRCSEWPGHNKVACKCNAHKARARWRRCLKRGSERDPVGMQLRATRAF